MGKKKTHAEFVAEVVNKPFTVLGVYTTAQVPVQLRCDVCATIWKATAGRLRKGTGCPSCADASTAYKNRKQNISIIN